MNTKPLKVLLVLVVGGFLLLCLVPIVMTFWWVLAGYEAKPPLVLLLLVGVGFLFLCLVPLVLWMLRCVRRGAWVKAAVLGTAAVGIVALSAWAVVKVAPQGARTLDILETPDGRMFIVRHYRFGWLEYPAVRFYARDPDGDWTVFPVIAELIDGNNTALTVTGTGSARQVQIGEIGGWYVVHDGNFVNVDGPGHTSAQLPPGIEPGQEDLSGHFWLKRQ